MMVSFLPFMLCLEKHHVISMASQLCIDYFTFPSGLVKYMLHFMGNIKKSNEGKILCLFILKGPSEQ